MLDINKMLDEAGFEAVGGKKREKLVETVQKYVAEELTVALTDRVNAFDIMEAQRIKELDEYEDALRVQEAGLREVRNLFNDARNELLKLADNLNKSAEIFRSLPFQTNIVAFKIPENPKEVYRKLTGEGKVLEVLHQAATPVEVCSVCGSPDNVWQVPRVSEAGKWETVCFCTTCKRAMAEGTEVGEG